MLSCPIRRKFRRGLFLLLSFFLSGCIVIPIPRDAHPPETRQNIKPEGPSPIVPGQTTKDEVFLILGEPDEASEDGSRVAYYWLKTKATVFLVAFNFFGVADWNKQYVFNITFDEKNVVLETTVQALEALPGLGYPAGPGRVHQRSPYLIERYSFLPDKGKFEILPKGTQIKVGQFTSSIPGQSKLVCAPWELVKTPGDEPFSTYIRNAFIMELKQVEGFSDRANVSISAILDKVDYVTSETFDPAAGTTGGMVVERYLVLAMTVSSSNGKTTAVREKYKIPMSPILSGSDCQDLAKGFLPAVQNLIGHLIRSPEFSALIGRENK